jgi:hypothetical protein
MAKGFNKIKAVLMKEKDKYMMSYTIDMSQHLSLPQVTRYSSMEATL